jgi:hypothetical protein
MAVILSTQVVISEGGITFGTSGTRGLVVDFTPHVCAAFTHTLLCVKNLMSFRWHWPLIIDQVAMRWPRLVLLGRISLPRSENLPLVFEW